MKKTFSVFTLLFCMCPLVSAQINPLKKVAQESSHLTARSVLNHYLRLKKVAQGVSHLTTQTERAVAGKLFRGPVKPRPIPTAPLKASSFTYRPIDQLRHSISAQTQIVGSEKKEAFVPTVTTSEQWIENQKQNYYTIEERNVFRNMITAQFPHIAYLRPNAEASEYALEEYIYKQLKNNSDVYLAPLLQGVIKDDLATSKQIMPYISGAAFSPHERRLEAKQLNTVNNSLLRVIYSSNKLLNFLPDDPYLKAVNECYTEIFRILNPLLSGAVRQAKISRPDGRKFQFNEFLLFDLEGKDYVLHGDTPWSEEVAEEVGNLHYLADHAQRESAEILKTFPKNLRIAVLNDDVEPLRNFTQWAQEGRLGENATVSTFEDGNDLLKSIHNGSHYDLIITDIYVPNGGYGMMPALRRLDEKVTVIAMSKCTRQRVRPLGLFETGMDGYLPYTPVLNDPEVGYLEFLRAFNNHLQLKGKYGWSR